MRDVVFYVETNEGGRHPRELEGCNAGRLHPGKFQFYIHNGLMVLTEKFDSC